MACCVCLCSCAGHILCGLFCARVALLCWCKLHQHVWVHLHIRGVLYMLVWHQQQLLPRNLSMHTYKFDAAFDVCCVCWSCARRDDPFYYTGGAATQLPSSSPARTLLHIHHHCHNHHVVGSTLAAVQPHPRQLRRGCSSRVPLCGGDNRHAHSRPCTVVLLCLLFEWPCTLSWVQVLQQLSPCGFLCTQPTLAGLRCSQGGAWLGPWLCWQRVCRCSCSAFLEHVGCEAHGLFTMLWRLSCRDCMFARAGALQQAGEDLVVLGSSLL